MSTRFKLKFMTNHSNHHFILNFYALFSNGLKLVYLFNIDERDLFLFGSINQHVTFLLPIKSCFCMWISK